MYTISDDLPAGMNGTRFKISALWLVLLFVAWGILGSGCSKEVSQPPPRQLPAERQPNVILFMADTLQAARLGCYGYAKPTSPRIDKFAEEGVTFLNAFSQASCPE